MPANTYAQLLDFPGRFSAAWGAIIAADATNLIGADTHADPAAFLFGPRDNSGAMPPDRIEYTSTGWHRASNQQVRASATGLYFDGHYAGQLHTAVVTPRAINVAAAEHDARVGRLVTLASAAAARFTANVLPYYEIAYLGLAGALRSEPAPEEDVDRTELSWDVEIWLKPDAFPAAAP